MPINYTLYGRSNLMKRKHLQKPATLAHLFAESAKAYSNRPAICIESEIQTYATLAASAGRICKCLRLSIKASSGICILATSRTFTGFSGILGALGAGMTYAPISPTTPDELVKSIAEITLPVAIIADQTGLHIAKLIARITTSSLVIVLPDHESCEISCQALAPHKVYTKSEIIRQPVEFEPVDKTPESLAYILFTSGTTGKPKGVPIRQQSVIQYVRSMASLYPLNPTDLCTQLFDLTFDLSVHDMFVTWFAGACLFVPHRGRALFAADLVEKYGLTVWFSVPSVVSELVRSRKLVPNSLRSLKLALFCGERLPIQLAKAMKIAAPDALLVNTYGPTEATIAFTHFAWDGKNLPAVCQDLPIGRPLPEQQVFLLDSKRQPVPPGTLGEIYLSGSQVSDGYWHNPTETTARFHNISLDGQSSQRVYATGDLGIAVPDIGLVFRGRIDDQVKLFGVRVELGEIEAVVRQATGGQQAAAMVWPPDYPTKLLSFVEKGDTTVAKILENCRELLPPSKRPYEIIEIERLPLTHNGKIDRKALATLYLQRKSPEIEEPSGEQPPLPLADNIESAVHAILLQQRSPGTPSIPDLKPDEDLFEHTDSLGFLNMIVELEERFAISIEDWMAVTRLDKLVQKVMEASGFSISNSAEIDCSVAEERHETPKLQRGLRNVILDYSSISKIDGKDGLLEYCGIPVNQLVSEKYTDVAFLLSYGRYPTEWEAGFALGQFRIGQQYEKRLSQLMEKIAANCPSPIKYILSVVPLFQPQSMPQRSSNWSKALQLHGFIAAATCRHAALARGVYESNSTLENSLPEWILEGLSGRSSETIEKQAIESLFVLLAECITNPATFAARIVTSTDADYESAIVAALAVFSGTKHGGATDDVMSMIANIEEPSNATDWVRTAQQEKKPVPGFGHRVFQVPDPRAEIIADWCKELIKAGADDKPLKIIEGVIDAMAPMRRHGTHVNVDAYTGTLLTMLGVPRGYGTLVFALARMAGWAAHVQEQNQNNIMINPLVAYRPRQA